MKAKSDMPALPVHGPTPACPEGDQPERMQKILKAHWVRAIALDVPRPEDIGFKSAVPR